MKYFPLVLILSISLTGCDIKHTSLGDCVVTTKGRGIYISNRSSLFSAAILYEDGSIGWVQYSSMIPCENIDKEYNRL